MQMSLSQFGIDNLTAPERLELIGMIWDSIPEPQELQPPEWHLRELEKRIAEADAHPEQGVRLENVKWKQLS
jgi:putative addiction module component (TIGR02574 family)